MVQIGFTGQGQVSRQFATRTESALVENRLIYSHSEFDLQFFPTDLPNLSSGILRVAGNRVPGF